MKESPPDSNCGVKVRQYLASVGLPCGIPWCLAYVHWCYKQVGVYLGGYGLVQAFDVWATKNGEIVSRPFRGDIVCYDWNNDHWDDHVGIVVKVLAVRWRGKSFAGWIKTVEGNTSYGNDSNGGAVMIRYRWVKSCRFARILG